MNNVQLHSRALLQCDWKCRVCSNLNMMKSSKCSLCGKLKGEKALGIAVKNWKSEHNRGKVDRAYKRNNKCNTSSAYTVVERGKKKKNESIKREYRMFIESKLRLDDQALLHQNFADEIQSVLADIRDCNSWNKLSQKMIKAYFRRWKQLATCIFILQLTWYRFSRDLRPYGKTSGAISWRTANKPLIVTLSLRQNYPMSYHTGLCTMFRENSTICR